ncbi:hypothetical protein OA92_02950 [Marinomonas sp. SBI22]|uniref:hypothetical protein n=1 Tax=unclassified Marinomonas TaxID=196814 RepID=UPI0007AF3067|nr:MULTISPECIES: hypothetical protein [unclassified Marinomonas]KZM38899.1 hypothetical protein OA91_23210 [Marinomonas sp. SBI8L]KZM44845.1 hypothetical protein OA92_02950 [Marinomonas sp. SBI22]
MKLLLLALMLCSSLSSASDLEDVKNAQGISEYLRFDEQVEVKKLGVLKNKYIAYNYTSIWGQAKRASIRLIILNKHYQMLGMYDITEWATSIEESCVVFPFDTEIGNKICLIDNNLPRTIWLDGLNSELFK